MKRQRRGIALITVLLVMVLLLTLVVAFISVSQAQAMLTGNTVRRQEAYNVALSAYQYAWSELELNPDFGKDGFPDGNTYDLPSGTPMMRVTQRDNGSGDPTDDFLEGWIHSEGDFDSRTAGHFTVEVLNKLDSRASTLYPKPLPARSVRLTVVAESQGVTRRLEVVLRKKPLVYESALAGDNLVVDSGADLWRIASRDPYVNRVRANTNVVGPAADRTRFAVSGIARAGNDISLGSISLTGSPGYIPTAEEKTNARFELGAPPVQVPDLNPEDIKLPSKSLVVDGGEYTFNGIEDMEWIPHDYTYDHDGDPDTDPETVTRYQLKVVTYRSLEGPNNQTWVSEETLGESLDPPGACNDENWGYGSAGEDGFDQPIAGQGDVQDLFNQDGAKLTANLLTGQFTVSPGAKLVPNGSGEFKLKTGTGQPPQLLFGYEMGEGGVPDFVATADGLEAALDDPQSHMSGIVAGGDVLVEGGVAGYGSLVSNGKVTVNASSGMQGVPGLSVALKGESIDILPAPPSAPTNPGSVTSADFQVFRTALAGQDWEQMNGWLDLTKSGRDSLTGATPSQGLRSATLSGDADYYWNELKVELGISSSPPNFVSKYGSEWSASNITLDQYVRLREFMQTLASGYDGGNGDITWLTGEGKEGSSALRIQNQVTTYSQWADSYIVSLEQYMQEPEQLVPDTFFQGLVYAGDGGFRTDANGNKLRFEGALISKGDIEILNSPAVEFIYNRDYLDDVLLDSSGTVRLEKIYFTMN